MSQRICHDEPRLMGPEKSTRYAYELEIPQCQRGGNDSMGQRVCPSQRSMGTQKSARYAYELESSSVKEAATIVWSDPCTPPTRCQARSLGQGQPTLMNRRQRGGNAKPALRVKVEEEVSPVRL